MAETLLERYMKSAAYQFVEPAPPIPERELTEAEKLERRIITFMRRSSIMENSPMVNIIEPWVPIWVGWFFPWLS
jgi:hypothetical protein